MAEHRDLAEAGAGLIEAGLTITIEILGAGGVQVESAAGDGGVDAHHHPACGGLTGGFSGIEELLHQLPAAGIHHIADGVQRLDLNEIGPGRQRGASEADEIKRPCRLLVGVVPRGTFGKRQGEAAIAVAVDPDQIVAPGIGASRHGVAQGVVRRGA